MAGTVGRGSRVRPAWGLRAVAAYGMVAGLLGGCSGTPAQAPAPPPPSATATSVPSGAVSLCTSPQEPFPKRVVDGGAAVIEPDQWNASGTVCLDTPGDTGFTVSAVRQLVPKSQGAPGAYPNIATAPGANGLPVPVSALGDATSDWSASAQVPGSYDLAYDLWYGPNSGDCDPGDSAELMIWLDATNSVQPAGSKVADAQTVGDTTYSVFQAPISGPHSVISYVRTAPTHTAKALDLRLFTADALVRGYVPGGSYLCKVSVGFEIWSGGVGLHTWSFAFHNRVGLPTGPLTAAAGTCLNRSGDALLLGGCDAATAWTAANDGTLRAGGLCLTAAPAAGGNTAAVLARCTGAAAQRWAAGSDRSLVQPESGRCLDTAGSPPAAVLQPCRSDGSQRWTIPYNGLM